MAERRRDIGAIAPMPMPTSRPAGTSPTAADTMLGQVLARARLAEGSAELLLGHLRLHTKRVRALTATFRRETHRVPSLVGAELMDVDRNLDLVATQITAALAAVDATFSATFA